MAESFLFLKKATAKLLASAAVESLDIPASTASGGTYQSPAKSRLKAEVIAIFSGKGLTRASHLLALLKAVESVRVRQATTGGEGSWEAPELNLRRRSESMLPRPEALVRPKTAREVLDLMQLAVFS
jgi:hypothetical protein